MSACANAPVCIFFQLVIVHIKQQAAVVVKHEAIRITDIVSLSVSAPKLPRCLVSVSAVHKPPYAAALCTGEYLIHD